MPNQADFIRCRTWGHAWFEADSDWTPLFGTPVTIRCERCNAERRDSIDRNGVVASRSYVHPEGYKYAKGEVPSRADMRLQIIADRLVAAKRTGRKRASGE